MTAAKRKGTAWESAVVRWLSDDGYANVERRALHGAYDRGDVAGIPGLVIEAKACKTLDLAAWVGELEEEMRNDGAETGVVLAKRRGRADPKDAYAIMPAYVWLRLLKEAGR